MDHRRSRRTRSILEAHRIVGNIRIENIPQGLLIKIRIVGAGDTFREGHQRNAHLVLHPRIHDRLPGINQIVHIVQCIEIPDRRNPVLPEQFGVQTDNIPGLGTQAHHIHPPGEGLQIRICPRGGAELIHHIEGVFITVEVE